MTPNRDGPERSPWPARWLALACTLLILFVYAINVVVYMGSSIESVMRWRLEHGRITVEHSERVRGKGFWVDANSEEMRWGWEFQRWGDGEFEITIPLWIPLLMSAGWLVWTFRPRSALGPRS